VGSPPTRRTASSAAARRSASTLARPRSAGPSRPPSQSTTAWFQRTKERISQSSSPSWASACRLWLAARSASPRSRASEARRNAIPAGTLASTLSPCGGPRDGSYGSSPLTAKVRSASPRSASTASAWNPMAAPYAWARHRRGRSRTDPRGQRRKPAAQGRALAAAQQRLDVPLDQPRRPGRVSGGQRVLDGVIGQVMVLAPGARGPVQRLRPPGLFSLQPGAQQIGEQVVVAPPATHLIQRHQK